MTASGPGWPANTTYVLPPPIPPAERPHTAVVPDQPGPAGCPVRLHVTGHGMVACDLYAGHQPADRHRVTIWFTGPEA